MKLKLAIIFGVLIWFLTYFLTNIFNPIFNDNLPYVNIMVPLLIIIITGFFGIIYIRNIDENEVIEGLLVGIVFIIVNMVLDYIFFIIPNANNPIIGDYPFHIASLIIITLLITTFLGYLAQMRIDLK